MSHEARPAAGRHETGHSLRQGALDPGFQGVPAGTDGAHHGKALRLLECYIARGAIVKKSTWSCSLGWACDPIRSGSTARRVCEKLLLIGGNNNDRPVADSANRRQADR
jgi:hypothetical protein